MKRSISLVAFMRTLVLELMVASWDGDDHAPQDDSEWSLRTGTSTTTAG